RRQALARLGPVGRARDLPDRRVGHRAPALSRADHRAGPQRDDPAAAAGRKVKRSLATLGMTILLVLLSCPGFAVEPSEMLKDAALESRARTLSRELRCVVCQNQSI